MKLLLGTGDVSMIYGWGLHTREVVDVVKAIQFTRGVIPAHVIDEGPLCVDFDKVVTCSKLLP